MHTVFLFHLVDCTWGVWVNEECSTTCGDGIQTDYREKLQDEDFGGNPCEGEATRETECNIIACPGTEMILNCSQINCD